MWPWLLGSAGLGATLGGIGAYQRSGGDLGATLQGALGGGLAGAGTAGLGGLAGGAVSRMAGQALEPLATGSSLAALKAAQGIPVLGKLLPKATTLAEQAGLGSSIVGAVKAAPKIAGLGANLATQAITAPIAGALGAGVVGLGGQALGGAAKAAASAATAMGAGRPGDPGMYNFANAVPQTGPLGPTAALGSSPWEIYDPTGRFAAERTLREMEGDAEIRNLKKLLAAETPYTEGAKKAEFQRGMAAAGIRQNIATQAAMLQNAQRTAQTIGINAANQMGQALASQYQYG